ncbi:gamma subclass chorismate mutase AroQ [Duganella sp. BJB488]|nr:gamma subclass chorismate mutase AroQ [Duganella sp. BJB489]RFP12520.1 gamma subclass chorismate mutase AroQ [Duganella sp. BJB488]RFP29089.1 gamma subclass chorismate mutase AroQ [Duganella sp. BJB480]
MLHKNTSLGYWTRGAALLVLLLAGGIAGAQDKSGERLDQVAARGENLAQLEPLRLAIDQRLLLAQGVARAKWNARAQVEDLPREAQVIRAAVEQGAALGLPGGWVEAVFRAQIEASKTVQRELFAQWRAQQVDHFADAPDLAKTVRPELDRLTAQILRSMLDNQSALRDPARKSDVARALGALEARTLSPAAAEQALAPFQSQQ